MRPLFRRSARVTANWHVIKACNYKCTFCYAHFDRSPPAPLDLTTSYRLLAELAAQGVHKVNFAGGEPLLHPHLHELVLRTVNLGMHASLVSNGSRLSRRFLSETGPLLSQIGLSCDSVDDRTNTRLGRGFGNHRKIVERAFKRMDDYVPFVQRKLNTVVMRPNLQDDFAPFLADAGVQRWKVFKFLRIQGENDAAADDLAIRSDEFEAFVQRHRGRAPIVPEDNAAMTGTYVMIDPEGRAYQNRGGRYRRGPPVHTAGLVASIREAGGFDYDGFVRRGGAYDGAVKRG